LHSAEKAA